MLEAFARGSVPTRGAYISIEHEWMHLETLAYMLAQEQRLSFEAGAASNGNAHPPTGGASSSSDDGVSEESMNQHASSVTGGVTGGNSHVNGVAGGRTDGGSHSNGVTGGITASNGHANGRGNGFTNGVTAGNGRRNGDGVAGHSVTNGNGHSVTNGDGNNCSHSRGGDDVGAQSGSVSMVQIPAGEVTLGTDTDPSKSFVWDNEGPQQDPQQVASFQVASRPVSNAEYYKFAVEAKGYEEEGYWLAEDLACLRKRKQLCPATWTVQVGPWL